MLQRSISETTKKGPASQSRTYKNFVAFSHNVKGAMGLVYSRKFAGSIAIENKINLQAIGAVAFHMLLALLSLYAVFLAVKDVCVTSIGKLKDWRGLGRKVNGKRRRNCEHGYYSDYEPCVHSVDIIRIFGEGNRHG